MLKLFENNDSYRNGDFKIISDIENQKILTKNKYGICNVRINELLRGSKPSIKSAIDKNKYCIEEFKDKRDFLYDYSLLNYVSQKHPVDIICKKHGVFPQSPDAHKKKHGCPLCGKEKNKLGKVEIERRLKAKNEGTSIKYNTNGVQLLGDYMEITCENNHVYKQRVVEHLNGNGCPVCADIRNALFFEKTLISNDVYSIFHYLYFFKITTEDEQYYKVGVAKNIKNRIGYIKKEIDCEVSLISEKRMSIMEAYSFEKFIIDFYKKYKYVPKTKFGGWTECFSEDVFYIYNNMCGIAHEEYINNALEYTGLTLEQYYNI